MAHPDTAETSRPANHHVMAHQKKQCIIFVGHPQSSATRSLSRRSTVNLSLTLAHHVAIDASKLDSLGFDKRDFLNK
jgi:hypothetical protein